MTVVPSNLIPPSDRRVEPASSGLHTFYIEKMSDKDFEKLDKVKNEYLETEFVVKLHRICKIQNKQTQKGQNKTQAQMALGLGKSGGASATNDEHPSQLFGSPSSPSCTPLQ